MVDDHEDPELKAIEDAILNSWDTWDDSKQKPLKKNELFIFPLLRRPFFPGMGAPLQIEPGALYEALKKVAQSENRYIGLFLTKSEDVDLRKIRLDDLNNMGVKAKILRITPLEQGGAEVVVQIENRISIEKPSGRPTLLKAVVKSHIDSPMFTEELKAYGISVLSTIKELLKLNPLFKEELQLFLGHSDFTEPGKMADFAVALTTASRAEMQDVLETLDVPERIAKALMLLKKELDISQLQSSINKKIDAAMNKTQKDFFLREQLKTIKKELGIERDDKSLDREKFEARLKDKIVPDNVLKVYKEELDKLAVLEPHAGEYGIVRGYLDWLTTLPWGIYSDESHDLVQAEKILEEDHYGLDDIKQRILELISVGKLTGGVRSTILCLVGPPGVGKTSIGKSIARALNRKFYRFSVGGMRDEAEIKGHRRTYIGAMPGKIIQALKHCQTMNPVIMLDEVDKMISSYHGDPAAALLEVLDPEQNAEFLDHYLDVRCDLSQIIFVVTANVLDTIPDALRDRMEVLRLSGYVTDEKVEIANKYLIPRTKKESGLQPNEVTFSKEAIRSLINGYAREAGVRTLENQIKKIMHKIALKTVREQQAAAAKGTPVPTVKYKLTPKDLNEYLGKPKFFTDRFYEKTPVGVCTGLAWTAMGGATLYIESIKIAAENSGMKLTGLAGDVMKESAEIAWSYLQSSISKYDSKSEFFTAGKKSQVHIHIPEGATPKDGPSAGITMMTSMLSLLKNAAVSHDLGMTGELTLTGKILPVGGIKEKLVAAKRSGLKKLIVPKENERDYEELPDHVRKGLTIHFVEHYDEVFPLAFPKIK